MSPNQFENCVVRHREGGMAPISVMSDRAVRPWARAIADEVVSRETPPQHADAAGSLVSGNDRWLTRPEIDTMMGPARGGVLQRNPRDLLALPPIAAGWQIRNLSELDVVVPMPAVEPISVSPLQAVGREIILGVV